MSQSTILSHSPAVTGRTGSAVARRARARDASGGNGLWSVLSQVLWHGRPSEELSDHLLVDIGVSRFDLETLQP